MADIRQQQQGGIDMRMRREYVYILELSEIELEALKEMIDDQRQRYTHAVTENVANAMERIRNCVLSYPETAP